MSAWNRYQEEVASFFRSLGLEAETNATVQGIRTSHDIDVLVCSSHVGFDLIWIVECKHWGKRVSKLHVLALREIVADVGADRGILMAESGFQQGALEASRLTNVQLTSLMELDKTAAHPLGMARLRALQERIDRCSDRYWRIDKERRIDYNLRPDVGFSGYSGRTVIEIARAAIAAAFRGSFPIARRGRQTLSTFGSTLALYLLDNEVELNTPRELFDYFEPQITELEKRLDAAEAMLHQDSRANPTD